MILALERSWPVCLALFALFASAAARRPNVVFILTDDQDIHMNSLDHMPLTQKYLVNEGTLYRSHYCTVSVCCPSRVNIWTGQMSHNTNVTDVYAPYGGYPKFISQGYNKKHLAYWMQQSGYDTYYSGKIFNAHSVDNYNDPPVAGFTGSDFLLDPFTYQYFNASMTRNAGKPVNYAGRYSGDLVAEKAYGFLEDALKKKDTPFFLTVAPVAPHANAVTTPTKAIITAPEYPKRYAHLFRDYKIPRTANFNPDTPSGVSWIAKLPKINDTVLEYNDEFQRHRLRALQSVDETVEGLVKRLEAAGELENTYIFYTTDNGYHISQHRLNPGKMCGFETDINVPLIVRGPGVAAGKEQFGVTSHTDLAPTIMELAGNPLLASFDGEPIPLTGNKKHRPEHLGVEYWGLVTVEGIYGAGYNFFNHTYKSVRIIGAEYNLYYSVWCTNEKELYDMNTDPGQLHNLLKHDTTDHVMDRHLSTLVDRLDALLMVLKSCKGKACVEPWKELHPKDNVQGLSDAMARRYDAFYQHQPKVSFSQCEIGYIVSSEGPQKFHVFGEGYDPMLVGPDWSAMT